MVVPDNEKVNETQSNSLSFCLGAYLVLPGVLPTFFAALLLALAFTSALAEEISVCCRTVWDKRYSLGLWFNRKIAKCHHAIFSISLFSAWAYLPVFFFILTPPFSLLLSVEAKTYIRDTGVYRFDCLKVIFPVQDCCCMWKYVTETFI